MARMVARKNSLLWAFCEFSPNTARDRAMLVTANLQRKLGLTPSIQSGVQYEDGKPSDRRQLRGGR